MNITKDQMHQLTSEQQEMLASLEIQRAKTREQLLKRVRHYRAMSWLPPLMMLPLYLAPTFITNPKYGPLPIICVSLSLWFLIQFHAAGINRRLDALLELLETDKRKDGHDA
jgi:hypothetical protein